MLKNFDFIKTANIWLSISVVALILSIVAIASLGLRWGLDFTGGSMLELRMEGEATAIADNLANLDELDLGTPLVQRSTDGTVIIRSKEISQKGYQQVITSLEDQFGEVERLRFTQIGPTVSGSVRANAVKALAIAILGIILYIAYAFRTVPRGYSPWKFGLAAIAALVHDVLLVVGVFAILGWLFGAEVDTMFVTALLTILGYSVHDSIVVFDRLRENLRYQKRDETFAIVADKAVKQTLARSINTSVTVLITLLALLILGGESIRWFIAALVAGVAVGTYSSIFIATPLLVKWQRSE